MKTLTTVAALIVAGFAAASASTSARAADSRPIAVSYADLDLATAKGRAILDRRLLHAARAACGTPSPADLRGRIKLDACVAEVRAAASPRLEAAIALAGRQSESVVASSR
jgi:UrcA family protein